MGMFYTSMSNWGMLKRLAANSFLHFFIISFVSVIDLLFILSLSLRGLWQRNLSAPLRI